MSTGLVKSTVGTAPKSPVTVMPSETAPLGAAEEHRSAAPDAEADGVASPPPEPEQPASRIAERATADRAANGRRRTDDLTGMGGGKGREAGCRSAAVSSSRTFICPR